MHIVISIPPALAISDVIKRLKGASAHDFPSIQWQHGYGVFSVSEKLLPFAIQYVQNQKLHDAENSIHLALEMSEEERN
jgi:putative transposase